jgi:hypothetical protein
MSRSLQDWETTVQVLDEAHGAQMLSEGLPFTGLTYETANGSERIELNLGSDPNDHQSHTIERPVFVAFEKAASAGPAGMLDIEDAHGTKTLIRFVRPFPVLTEYVKPEMSAAR